MFIVYLYHRNHYYYTIYLLNTEASIVYKQYLMNAFPETLRTHSI